MDTQEQLIMANGHNINTLRIGKIDPEKPTLVFIHGGLDCIAMWRKFPYQMVEETGLSAIVYERWGHGKSDMLVVPLEYDAREEEANQPLKDLFAYYGLGEVILVGHSFGGGIALIASGMQHDQIIGTVAIAPQLVSHGDIKEGLDKAIAAYDSGKLRDKLIPFHGDNTDILFRNWSSGSTDPNYVPRDYAEYLVKITCPVLEIYGTDDNYGYLHNLEHSRKHISSPLSVEEIKGSTHYPHLDSAETVLKCSGDFISSLLKQD
ncbi:MAG: alpha/beta hydrolase [Pseudomonadales bacterium]|nr:alpha/beta hydrolase [Pseudomonadales bacterium]